MTGSGHPSGPRLTGELADAWIVALPLRGEWTAVTSPGARIPSHGTDALGQRYAFDFQRLDRRGRFHPASAARLLLAGVPTRTCHGYGEPVFPLLPGEVIAASDGRPERDRVRPILEAGRALRTAATFRPDRLGDVMGNHVLIRHEGGAWSGYAHLVPGSVHVHVGQVVSGSDVLGRVGHTGNSTAPHLHVQLMDGPDPLTARGLPCAFHVYEVETPAGWVRVESAVPLPSERIRSAPEVAAGEAAA